MLSVSCCGLGNLLRSFGRPGSDVDRDHPEEYAEPHKRPIQCTDGQDVDQERDGKASGPLMLETTESNGRSKGPIQCTDEAEGRRRSTGKESKVKVSVETTSVCGKKMTVTVFIAENEE
ncbi:uncharacterized protein LOC114958143 [Acropora millepora]|uniref:uncharacterized protein LOC114958143 n=1 Tax=Acropora millepora TaxID=45264 RepID=UPI001CF5EF59|nr:uncharacterized protein LOC114958143 [Acropora millepora]